MRKRFFFLKIFVIYGLFFYLFLNNGFSFTKTVAVLPFKNLTPEKDFDWLGSAISSTLTTKFYSAGLSVLERSNIAIILDEINFSQTGYVDAKKAVKIGNMAGAGILVLGEFQKSGHYCRINARFVDTETGVILSAVDKTGTIEGLDFFNLQDDIALALLESQGIALEEKIRENISVNPTENFTAFEYASKAYEAQCGVNGVVDLDGAIRNYTMAINLDPEYTEAYNNRGIIYKNKGLFDNAISDYTSAISLNPKYSNAYTNRGIVYAIKDLFNQSISDFNTAISLNPNDAEAYYNRGFAYKKMGDYNKALFDFNMAVKLNPNDPETYFNRGNTHYFTGNVNQAISDYTTAIKLNPQYADAYYNRGNVWGDKQNFDQAISDLKTAVRLKPDYSDAYYNIGIIYIIIGNADEGWNNIEKAQKLGYKTDPEKLRKLREISQRN